MEKKSSVPHKEKPRRISAEKSILSKTEDKGIVEIPVIARIRPIAIEPQIVFVAFQLEDVRAAVPVSFV